MQQKTIDKSYKREIIFNYSFKIAAILLGLVSTRLNIKYLGNDLYGLWATVISIVSWFNLGDLGISNGFRNELAKAIGENDSEKIEKLTNSVFSIMLRLSVVIFVVFIIVINILFFFQLLPYELRVPIYITGFFFCVNFVLGATRSIAYANQLSWLNSLVQFVTVFF
jgi:O-antigen/teichoic acid export membrane protein